MRKHQTNGILVRRELLREQPFGIRQSPAFIKKSPSAVYLLINEGKVSPVTGETVKLECCFRADGSLATSKEAVQRFEEKLNSGTEQPSESLSIPKLDGL